MKKEIKVVAFDADDTLWVNELYFQEAEKQFCSLLGNYLPQEEISYHLDTYFGMIFAIYRVWRTQKL